jgi:NADPH:quinone reductase-like Zn-dependent oxidoreductase
MGMLERAHVRDGETVVVTGASGGVGFALVQLVAARGARVIAVTSPDKDDLIRASGADDVARRTAGDLSAAVAELAPGGIDVVGGQLVTTLLPSLVEGGRWVIAGAVAGPIIEFDLRRLYLNNRAIIGSSMHIPAHFAALIRQARTGQVSPRVAASYALADIHAAQREFLDRAHVGKIIVTSPG